MAIPVNKRVAKRRNILREAGLRPVQIWLPDTRKSSFGKECHRQSQLLRDDMQEKEILNWIEQANDDEGWV
jgi:hypothetical protein